jgi:hypothetical protein
MITDVLEELCYQTTRCRPVIKQDTPTGLCKTECVTLSYLSTTFGARLFYDPGNWEILKRGIGEGWKRSVKPIE